MRAGRGGGAGSQLSAIHLTNQPYYDVRKYGAVGDGSTNDTAAIAAAIAAATAAGGGTVLFPPAVYRFTTLTITGTDILLLGGPGTILETTSTAANIVVFSGARSGCQGIHFRTSGTATAGTHVFLNAADCYATECVSTAHSTAYTIGAAARCRLQNNRVVSTTGNAIVVGNGGNSDAPIINDNIVQSCTGVTLQLAECSGAAINGNQFLASTGGDVVTVASAVQRARIIDNLIQNGADDGIFLNGCGNCIVTHNNIIGCSNIAIRVAAGTNGALVRHNRALSTNYNGVFVTDYTIATGAVTLVGDVDALVIIDTEGAGATDDLDTLSGGLYGQIVTIRAAHVDRTVVIKDGTGNIRAAGDMSLTHTDDTWTGVYDGAVWRELGRSDSAA